MCLRVLKESNKSRFDRYSHQKQCIDHIPYYLSRLSCAHFSRNPKNSCIHRLSMNKFLNKSCSIKSITRLVIIVIINFYWHIKRVNRQLLTNIEQNQYRLIDSISFRWTWYHHQNTPFPQVTCRCHTSWWQTLPVYKLGKSLLPQVVATCRSDKSIHVHCFLKKGHCNMISVMVITRLEFEFELTDTANLEVQTNPYNLFDSVLKKTKIT